MLEALGEWMGHPLLYSVYGGKPPGRSGASHATIAPYGPFGLADGSVINLGLQNEREWENFCSIVLRDEALVHDERFSANHRRVANRVALDEVVRCGLARLGRAEALSRLDDAQIAYADQRTVAQFAEHPQLEARGRW